LGHGCASRRRRCMPRANGAAIPCTTNRYARPCPCLCLCLPPNAPKLSHTLAAAVLPDAKRATWQTTFDIGRCARLTLCGTSTSQTVGARCGSARAGGPSMAPWRALSRSDLGSHNPRHAGARTRHTHERVRALAHTQACAQASTGRHARTHARTHAVNTHTGARPCRLRCVVAVAARG
jgi:hypothetical protein